MKTSAIIVTGLLGLLLIAFIVLPQMNGTGSQGAPQAPANDGLGDVTSTPPIPTRAATPTLTALQNNLAEARRLAAEYDQAVQAELQSGTYRRQTDPQTGKEAIIFTGASSERIALLYDEFSEQFFALNQQYETLYIAEVQPTPFPTQPSEEENQAYFEQLAAQYPAFFEQAMAEGETVLVYDPSDGLYYERVIGDAYARGEIMTDALEALRQAPDIAQVDQQADIELIRAVLKQPELALSFVGVSGLTNAHHINSAVYEDEARTSYYVALDAGTLAAIQPMAGPDVPATDVLPIDEVRELAEQFARENSTNFIQLQDQLVFEQGGKGDIYFFTWRLTGQDWAQTEWKMMPPFLQIGMSADGKITTYINSIDLFDASPAAE